LSIISSANQRFQEQEERKAVLSSPPFLTASGDEKAQEYPVMTAISADVVNPSRSSIPRVHGVAAN
jgi:hypothetical protein